MLHAYPPLQRIKRLLSPLPPERTRSVRAVGFNYIYHAEQLKVTIPTFPILFFKPWTALAGPFDDVPITSGYQNSTNFTSKMNYEAELVVVVGRKVFNVSEDEALDAVLGCWIRCVASRMVDREGREASAQVRPTLLRNTSSVLLR